MAKSKNSAATERITISTTPQVVEVLKWLAEKGYFGKNPADVAEELVRIKLREEYIEMGKFPGADTQDGSSATEPQIRS